MSLFDLTIYRNQAAAAFGFFLRPRADIEQIPLARAPLPFLALVIAGVVLALLATMPLIALQQIGGSARLPAGAVSAAKPLLVLLLVGALLVPVVEECAFRALLRPRPFTLGLAAAAWGYLIAGLYPDGSFTAYQWSAGLVQLSTQTLVAILLGSLAFFAAARDLWSGQFAKLWPHVFAPLYWVSIFAFALAHLARYSGMELERVWLLVPVLVLPQFVAAVIFSFARMRYGLGAAIIAHGLNNGALTLLFAWL